MDTITVVPLELRLDQLTELVDESLEQGHRHILRLVEEYNSGANKFDRVGEALFAAIHEGKVVGVCGLNHDPYSSNGEVGRVRRLYILKRYRRNGIARQLMNAIIQEAKEHYETLVLFTDNPSADMFYRSIGFAKIDDYEKTSHRFSLNS